MQLNGLQLSPSQFLLMGLIAVWSIFWKGLALWHTVKRGEKKWFIVILVLNTFGILELIYPFYVIKIKSISLD